MKKSYLTYLFLFIGLLIFIEIINYLTRNSNDNLVIRDIKVEIKGEIIKKIDVRKGIFLHLKIHRNKKPDTIIFAGGFIDHINIGDLIVKNKNTPYCFVIHNKVKKKYPFTLIPKKMIHKENFPPAWRDSCKTVWKPLLVD